MINKKAAAFEGCRFFVWAWGVTEATSGGTRIPLRGDLIRRFAPPSPCAGKALGGALRAAGASAPAGAGRMCHPEEGNPTKDLEGAGRVYRSGQGERNRASGARSFDSLCSLRMTAGAAKRQWGSLPAWGACDRHQRRDEDSASRRPHPALRATFPVRGEGIGRGLAGGGGGDDRAPMMTDQPARSQGSHAKKGRKTGFIIFLFPERYDIVALFFVFGGNREKSVQERQRNESV